MLPLSLLVVFLWMVDYFQLPNPVWTLDPRRPQRPALCLVSRYGLEEMFLGGYKEENIWKRFGEAAGLSTNLLFTHIPVIVRVRVSFRLKQ